MTIAALKPYPGTTKTLDRLQQYMRNVSMELNLKLGHTNHSVALPGDVKQLLFLSPTQTPVGTTTAGEQSRKPVLDTIILGADVTHPLKGSSISSIAAVVGSVDEYFSRYAGSVRYQQGGKEVSTTPIRQCNIANKP
jgi:hypothetical protein